jgi:hypothetical protein
VLTVGVYGGHAVASGAFPGTGLGRLPLVPLAGGASWFELEVARGRGAAPVWAHAPAHATAAARALADELAGTAGANATTLAWGVLAAAATAAHGDLELPSAAQTVAIERARGAGLFAFAVWLTASAPHFVFRGLTFAREAPTRNRVALPAFFVLLLVQAAYGEAASAVAWSAELSQGAWAWGADGSGPAVRALTGAAVCAALPGATCDGVGARWPSSWIASCPWSVWLVFVGAAALAAGLGALVKAHDSRRFARAMDRLRAYFDTRLGMFSPR